MTEVGNIRNGKIYILFFLFIIYTSFKEKNSNKWHKTVLIFWEKCMLEYLSNANLSIQEILDFPQIFSNISFV